MLQNTTISKLNKILNSEKKDLTVDDFKMINALKILESEYEIDIKVALFYLKNGNYEKSFEILKNLMDKYQASYVLEKILINLILLNRHEEEIKYYDFFNITNNEIEYIMSSVYKILKKDTLAIDKLNNAYKSKYSINYLCDKIYIYLKCGEEKKAKLLYDEIKNNKKYFDDFIFLSRLDAYFNPSFKSLTPYHSKQLRNYNLDRAINHIKDHEEGNRVEKEGYLFKKDSVIKLLTKAMKKIEDIKPINADIIDIYNIDMRYNINSRNNLNLSQIQVITKLNTNEVLTMYPIRSSYKNVDQLNKTIVKKIII